MTTKFTTRMMAKMMMPMMKLPPIIREPKAWITSPAELWPSWPWVRTSRVEARFRPRRNRVETSRTVGKMAKSSGRFIITAVIRISTLETREMASSMSSRNFGIGRISSRMTPMTPVAMATSPRANQPKTSLPVGRAMPSFIIDGTSVIRPRHGPGRPAPAGWPRR